MEEKTFSVPLLALLFHLCCLIGQVYCGDPQEGSAPLTTEPTQTTICPDPNGIALNALTGDCVTDLFAKYGEDGSLQRDGFRQLLANVGLGVEHKHEGHEHAVQTVTDKAHILSEDLHPVGETSNQGSVGYKQQRAEERVARGVQQENATVTEPTIWTTHDTKHPDHHDNEHHNSECLSPDEIMDTFSLIPSKGITPFQFMQLCPILLQQLDSHVCVIYDVHPPGDEHNHSDHTAPPSTHTDATSSKLHAGQLWGYSIGAVSMISIASITCIMMVPCIQRFPLAYGRLLSFLVAMAVGTLSGDSILHLLPHAFGIHGHEEEAAVAEDGHAHATSTSESSKEVVVWRGCVMLLGIFSFFIFEQVMRMCQKRPKEKLITLVQGPPSEQEISCHSNPCEDEDSKVSLSEANRDVMGSQEIGERLCNHNETAHELIPMMHQSSPDEVKVVNERYSGVFSFKHKGSIPHTELRKEDTLEEEETRSRSSCSLDVSVTKDQEAGYNGVSTSICKDPAHFEASTPKKEKETVDDHHDQHHDHHHDHDYHQHHAHHGDHHHHSHHHHSHHHHHHGHSHAHGHTHGGKMGISAIAWMVVMGDGIHNFTDGLVVGAAFADSLAGGLSTAIAVMCHEIPHELGDFAVMLRGGMSIKQALGFQAVSSILAYLGMAIGICIGNLNSVSLWIFALAGGAFLYIALTDLFPEMVESMNNTTDSKACHLLLQVLGALFGIGTMLIIALYEERLIEALS